MRFEKVDYERVSKGGYSQRGARREQLSHLLIEFLISEIDCVEVIVDSSDFIEDANNLRRSLQNTIVNMRADDVISVFMCNHKVYLKRIYK